MFYLKEFFGTLWDLRGRGIFFGLATLVLALVCAFRPSVSSGLVALAPDAWARPYFTALFDSSVNATDVINEIKRRPEVAEVQALNQAETGGVLGRLITQMGGDYSGKARDVASFGLRVVLKNAQMMNEGQSLVNGLEQSYGTEHVTTSGVRSPKVGSIFQTHPLFRYLSRFGYAGVLVPAALIWALAFSLCFPHFSRRAWLTERFQRRTLVRAKTTASGLGAIALVAVLVSLVLQGPDVVGLALCVGLFSIPWAATMKEVKWRSQN